MEIILILLFVIGIPFAWFCREISYKQVDVNWGWPKTVGFENPTGPIPTIRQILGWDKFWQKQKNLTF